MDPSGKPVPNWYPWPKDKRQRNVIHAMPYETNPGFVGYNLLEPKRIVELGLQPRYARMWDIRRNVPLPVTTPNFTMACQRLPAIPMKWGNAFDLRNKVIIGNSVAPFATMQRKTCGWGYDDEGDYRRKLFGLDPLDLQLIRPRPEGLRYRNSHFPKVYDKPAG